MPDADDDTSTPVGPSVAHRIDVGGSVTGSVIAGNHNVVVDAQHGSQVTVVVGPERPHPQRRERAEVLPRSLPEPVGREEAAQALAAAVRAGGPVQLWGPPGVGKTTLLRHAARLLPPGPDGTVFLGGANRDVEDLTQDVFEACYEAPGYAPNRTELQRLMTGVRVTVYVDDADLTSDQLLELMDAAPQATFVFASAERTLWSGGTALELCGLSQTAGLELLERELGGPLPGMDHETAAALWQAAGGLPLPLLRAAAVARSDPQGEGRLPRVGEVTDLLPALLDQQAEDESVMGVLHLLATFDGAEVAAIHVGALTDVAEPDAVCDRLVRLGLARLGEYGYASVADTVPVVRGRFPHRSRPSGCATTSRGGRRFGKPRRRNWPPTAGCWRRWPRWPSRRGARTWRCDSHGPRHRGWPARSGSACGGGCSAVAGSRRAPRATGRPRRTSSTRRLFGPC